MKWQRKHKTEGKIVTNINNKIKKWKSKMKSNKIMKVVEKQRKPKKYKKVLKKKRIE